MIKKIFFPIITLALCLTACDAGKNQNTQTFTYSNITNLIADTSNPESLAQATVANYIVTEDYDNGSIELSASDIIVNNQKYSFESDTLMLKPKYFGNDISYKAFSRIGNISKGGSTASNMDGFFAAYYIPVNAGYSSLTTSDLLSQNYKFNYTISSVGSYSNNSYFFPLLDYVLNDTYRITTFMPVSCYVGSSYITDGHNGLNTKDTGYQVVLDFSKKEATVYVLGVELLADEDSETPKTIRLDNIPIVMTHDRYRLEAASPKTTVPGKTSDGTMGFVESADYQVTDFSLSVASQDLTEVIISYKVAGKTVTFEGCSILKQLR